MTDNQQEYTLDILPPDITPYRKGNTGVEYFTTFKADAPGPHVMVTAIMHGNELCGAIAVDQLFKKEVRPRRGTLTLGFVNVAAFHSFNPAAPTLSRFVDEDCNRLWDAATLDGDRDSVELRRAREIRSLLNEVDFLLDIHSMQQATEPLMMAGPLAKGRSIARSVGVPETVVSDPGHAAGRRMRDYEWFSDPDDSRNALLVECGQHWEAASETVAIESTWRFLHHLEVVSDEDAAPWLSKSPPQQRFIEVVGPITIETDEFRFIENYVGMEVIAETGTVIGHDGDKLVTTPFDDCVLIMPSLRRAKGQTAVRLGRFIEGE